MSTRAIVTITDGEKTQRIYAHGDGYPKELGQLVKYFTNIAPGIDPNSGFKKRIPGSKYSPYGFVPDVATEPDKFTASLLGYLWKKGYTSAYLTDRDPEKEAKEDWSDIEWHYVVTLPGTYGTGRKPSLKVFEQTYTSTGDGGNKGSFKEIKDVEWESYDGKTPYWVVRKQQEAEEKKRIRAMKVPAVVMSQKATRKFLRDTGGISTRRK